jgi:hypothetical protein
VIRDVALLTPEWSAFSHEPESLRNTWQDSIRPALGDTFQANRWTA